MIYSIVRCLKRYITPRAHLKYKMHVFDQLRVTARVDLYFHFITIFLHEQSNVVFSSHTTGDINLEKVNKFIGQNQTYLFIFPYMYITNVRSELEMII